jgi:RNA polymerase sigma factor (sigma-70 family)
METTDLELVERSRRRDAEAFGALVTRHQQLVFGVALARCGDPALAEDVAQEAFVAAWRDLDRLRDADQVGSWVAGIARNLAASAARTRARRERVVVEPRGEIPPTPEDEALQREDRELLGRALAEIPDVHREVLVLFYLQGESIAKIARALAISEDAVKQRLSRGRGALRESVADRVENALTRTRLRPAFGAGVAALLTAGAKEATAGKVVFAMSMKKIAIVVMTLVVAGGAVWLGTRDRDAQQAGAATPGASAPTAPANTTKRVGKLHAEKLTDRAAHDRLLAKIRDAQARRNDAGAATTHAATERPALPDDIDLDKEYIRAAVKEILPMIADCYNRGLEREPALGGTIVVDFTIEGEPSVGGVISESSIVADKSTLADAQVRECVQETMYALQIDPPSGGGKVKVVYPFAFSNDEPSR